jgi:hypothetical protein
VPAVQIGLGEQRLALHGIRQVGQFALHGVEPLGVLLAIEAKAFAVAKRCRVNRLDGDFGPIASKAYTCSLS